MPGIFISYRREDSPGHAGRLFDRLRASLGRNRVFMDITGIEAGVDFVDTIERAIGSCDALLAVIGPQWATCTDEAGRPRLADPTDFIRIEIATALKRGVRVIPVLVDGAAMPRSDLLPDDLKALARRQAVELRDTRWDADVGDLVAVLERILGAAGTTERDPGMGIANPDGRTESDRRERAFVTSRPARSHWNRWWLAGAIVVALLAVATGAFWKFGAPRSTTDINGGTAGAVTVPPMPATDPDPQNDRSSEAGRGGAGDATAGPAAARGASDAVERAEISVPDVNGLPLDRAVQRLRAAGLAPGSEEGVAAPGVQSFTVVGQQPGPGTSLGRGGRVNLTYARAGRTLPLVTGRPLDEAVAEIRELGFVPGTLTGRPTDKAPANQVLEQGVPAGRELQPGARIDLVYAQALPVRVVPSVVGLTMADALAALKQAGIATITRRAVSDAKATPGQVTRQSPAAGTPARDTVAVVLEYSTRRGLAVPNVVKMSSRLAVDTLTAAGFKAQIAFDDTAKGTAGIVIRQSPGAGAASTSDDPVVMLTVIRASSPAVSLFIYYETEKDRGTAERLAAYLGGYRLAAYRVVASRGRRSGASIVYYSSRNESLARSLAARSERWLSDELRQRVSLKTSLESGGREDYILMWVPSP